MMQLVLRLLHSNCNRCFAEHSVHVPSAGDVTFLSSPSVNTHRKSKYELVFIMAHLGSYMKNSYDLENGLPGG